MYKGWVLKAAPGQKRWQRGTGDCGDTMSKVWSDNSVWSASKRGTMKACKSDESSKQLHVARWAGFGNSMYKAMKDEASWRPAKLNFSKWRWSSARLEHHGPRDVKRCSVKNSSSRYQGILGRKVFGWTQKTCGGKTELFKMKMKFSKARTSWPERRKEMQCEEWCSSQCQQILGRKSLGEPRRPVVSLGEPRAQREARRGFSYAKSSSTFTVLAGPLGQTSCCRSNIWCRFGTEWFTLHS